MSTHKENTQVDSPSVLTSFEDEENAQVEIAEIEITKVVLKYFDFLQAIAIAIKEIMDDENQKKKEIRKFLAIKKSCLIFLSRIKGFSTWMKYMSRWKMVQLYIENYLIF